MTSTHSRHPHPLLQCGTRGLGWLLIADRAQAADSAPWLRVSLESPLGPAWAWTLLVVMLVIVVLLAAYTFRHYWFSLNRLFGDQRHPYASVVSADWPRVTIFVAAHNEEAVIEDCLVNLMGVDYPEDRMLVVPVNDRSKDRTREIIDAVVARFPGRIRPFHRVDGKPGKAAALKDATETVDTDFIIVFDADYLPSRGLIRRLMAPFFDPEVGAVMGRVVPQNCGANLLTRLLDLERSGGYQVDQQARMNLGLVPQYGGTVGGIRLSALHSVGGWHDDVLAEDTDLTYRLLLGSWKTIYQNRAECYEEVPQNWSVRTRQIKRWAKGHNQAMWRHTVALLRQSDLRWRERIDGVLLLGVYIMAPVLIIGWVVSLLLYFTVSVQWIAPALMLMAFMTHGALGNFAAFFEIAAATHMDRSHHRIRLLAFNWLGFIVSAVAITRGALEQMVLDRIGAPKFQWDKTIRYRTAPAKPGAPA
ncbi:glycosyltransferase family 2 protein [Sphaerotilus sp.]|jgi:cellulose synthase/poly-beta-1,6-N-acetylglucosamine synthase-like glycosyltransferase|uniref:glycosyltransferase family 2 protein n=1 Tax=Sphaerotilus sp. TaxID=2093942 RepID=UPI0025E85927|nr:glycosyltransferase family 2 protein [Sphaerotilus sp.]